MATQNPKRVSDAAWPLSPPTIGLILPTGGHPIYTLQPSRLIAPYFCSPPPGRRQMSSGLVTSLHPKAQVPGRRGSTFNLRVGRSSPPERRRADLRLLRSVYSFEVSGARAMLFASGLIARHFSVIASNSVHARCSGASLSCLYRRELYRREQQSGGASALTNLFAQGSGG